MVLFVFGKSDNEYNNRSKKSIICVHNPNLLLSNNEFNYLIKILLFS